MDNRSSILKWTAVFSATLAGSALYGADDTQTLQQEIQRLQQRIEQLESRRGPTAADVDATVQRVLADADQRSQLLSADGRLTAGWDNGFFIGSADGNYLLRPAVQLQ